MDVHWLEPGGEDSNYNVATPWRKFSMRKDVSLTAALVAMDCYLLPIFKK